MKLKAYPVSPQPSKGIFFTMETNYLEQIEEALINAAIEKQIELEPARKNPFAALVGLKSRTEK